MWLKRAESGAANSETKIKFKPKLRAVGLRSTVNLHTATFQCYMMLLLPYITIPTYLFNYSALLQFEGIHSEQELKKK